MDQAEFDRTVQSDYPLVEWAEPIAMENFCGGGVHYGCRLCIGFTGITGRELTDLPTDIEVVRKHIREAHVLLKVP